MLVLQKKNSSTTTANSAKSAKAKYPIEKIALLHAALQQNRHLSHPETAVYGLNQNYRMELFHYNEFLAEV